MHKYSIIIELLVLCRHAIYYNDFSWAVSLMLCLIAQKCGGQCNPKKALWIMIIEWQLSNYTEPSNEFYLEKHLRLVLSSRTWNRFFFSKIPIPICEKVSYNKASKLQIWCRELVLLLTWWPPIYLSDYCYKLLSAFYITRYTLSSEDW